MKRRILTLILALALLVPLIPAPTRAVQTDDLEDEISQQLSAYIDSLGTPNASAAKNMLINHALFGNGKVLQMDERDAFTVAALNADLMQTGLPYALAGAVHYSLNHNMDTIYLAGDVSWYKDNLFFYVNVYRTNQGAEIDNTHILTWLEMLGTKYGTDLSPNACDNAMIDVVGASRLNITLHRTNVDAEKVSYRAEIKLLDTFNFDGSQGSATNLGGWLAGAGIIDTFSMEASCEFTFTVSNPCIHQSGNFRWEYDGEGLYSVTGETLGINKPAQLEAYSSGGELRGTYYRLEKTVMLSPEREWTLEFRMQCGQRFTMMDQLGYSLGLPYLQVDAGRIAGIVYGQVPSLDGDDVPDNVYSFHGCPLPNGYGKEQHTYRLENRIAEDGTAMVWLLMDGVEQGPMSHLWKDIQSSETGKYNSSDTGLTSDWIGQTTFRVNYLFNNSHAFDPQKTKIDYIQIWENGEGNAPYSYFVDTTAAPTCAEGGKIVHTCSLCGASWSEETGEPALGHTWDGGTITTAPSCTADGVMTYVCASDPAHIRTEGIPATGHSPVADAAVDATCTVDGLTEGSHCEVCGEILVDQNSVPATGHSWDDGVMTDRPNVNAPGTLLYTCQTCGEMRSEEIPYDPQITRLAGENRFETAFVAADEMKAALGVEQFDTIVVASGMDFADALSGSYLATVKDAPILLACNVEWINNLTKDYIKANLAEGGTVYILGGENAVPASFEIGLDGFAVTRLAGGNRFETNLRILDEAGVGDKPILVCTGLSFADSLSASATELPILLVWNDLTEGQKELLDSLGDSPFYIIGGESAVSAKMEEQLTDYGTVERVAGENRFETSVAIAEKFFDSPETAVLAYAWNFPDGLCGGPLAATLNAPLILTMDKYETQAAAYVQNNAISNGIILGGEGLISDSSVNLIFGTTQ